ncbi:MAG: Riboflavin biosynthesis protein RibF [Clostridia bacterium 41_269]|nr:MAG: Riboflavin biosynthesis protein RibF [Clostridia bacterium 41_269]
MKIITGIPSAGSFLHTVNYIALGNFDGVHRGHKKIINTMVKDAKNSRAKSIVVTFNPHPGKILSNKYTKLITTNHAKAKLISALNIDVLVFFPFNKKIAEIQSDEFIKNILVKIFNPSCVYVGYNYTFGSGGIGTAELLKNYGQKYNFDVKIFSPVCLNSQPISSTLIRKFIAVGEIYKAKECLGYWPFIHGKVVVGDRLGRKIGFPTANLHIQDDILLPPNGVYAGMVSIDNKKYIGVANIGVRPTVTDENNVRVEIHVVNFDGNLYGKSICFSFRNKIRDEKKFKNLEELKEQIKKDIEVATTKLSKLETIFYN